jgi:hypothetical protein
MGKEISEVCDDPALCKNDPELKRHINLKTKSNYFSEVTGDESAGSAVRSSSNKMAYHY